MDPSRIRLEDDRFGLIGAAFRPGNRAIYVGRRGDDHVWSIVINVGPDDDIQTVEIDEHGSKSSRMVSNGERFEGLDILAAPGSEAYIIAGTFTLLGMELDATGLDTQHDFAEILRAAADDHSWRLPLRVIGHPRELQLSAQGRDILRDTAASLERDGTATTSLAAARRLELTEQALDSIRRRISRTSLQAYRMHGRWYVVLDNLARSRSAPAAVEEAPAADELRVVAEPAAVSSGPPLDLNDVPTEDDLSAFVEPDAAEPETPTAEFAEPEPPTGLSVEYVGADTSAEESAEPMAAAEIADAETVAPEVETEDDYRIAATTSSHSSLLDEIMAKAADEESAQPADATPEDSAVTTIDDTMSTETPVAEVTQPDADDADAAIDASDDIADNAQTESQLQPEEYLDASNVAESIEAELGATEAATASSDVPVSSEAITSQVEPAAAEAVSAPDEPAAVEAVSAPDEPAASDTMAASEEMASNADTLEVGVPIDDDAEITAETASPDEELVSEHPVDAGSDTVDETLPEASPLSDGVPEPMVDDASVDSLPEVDAAEQSDQLVAERLDDDASAETFVVAPSESDGKLDTDRVAGEPIQNDEPTDQFVSEAVQTPTPDAANEAERDELIESAPAEATDESGEHEPIAAADEFDDFEESPADTESSGGPSAASYFADARNGAGARETVTTTATPDLALHLRGEVAFLRQQSREKDRQIGVWGDGAKWLQPFVEQIRSLEKQVERLGELQLQRDSERISDLIAERDALRERLATLEAKISAAEAAAAAGPATNRRSWFRRMMGAE